MSQSDVVLEVILLGRCLGDPLTVRILSVLRQGELASCELETVLATDRSRIVERLLKLRESGMVKTRKRADWAAFRIASVHRDLVETIFESFKEELEWDADLSQDAAALAREMEKRVQGWCASGRPRRPQASDEPEDPFGSDGSQSTSD